MPVIAFIGYQGSGKTLSMIREAKRDYDNGMRIISNIKLEGIKYTELDLKWFYGYLLQKKDLNNVVVIIDEIQLYADAREHRKQTNKVIGYFALQTRKRNVKFYFTTQYIDNIDKRLRLCALDDMIILCDGIYKRDKNNNKILTGIKQTIMYKGKILKRLITKPEIYYKYYKTGQVLQMLED